MNFKGCSATKNTSKRPLSSSKQSSLHKTPLKIGVSPAQVDTHSSVPSWPRSLRLKAERFLSLSKPEAIDYLAEDWLKALEDPNLCSLSSASRKAMFQELEIFLKQVTPPEESFADSFSLFTLWEEYCGLCSSPEHLLYWLEEASMGINYPGLYIRLARLHLAQGDFILCDEWIRRGLQVLSRVGERSQSQRVSSGPQVDFQRGIRQLEKVQQNLDQEVTKELMDLLGNDGLSGLYCKGQWNKDPGISIEKWDQLFKDPIQKRREKVLRIDCNTEKAGNESSNIPKMRIVGIKPPNKTNLAPQTQAQYLSVPKKTRQESSALKRLSDTCFVEPSKDRIIWVDREKRQSYIGETSLKARELEYRRILLQENRLKNPEDEGLSFFSTSKKIITKVKGFIKSVSKKNQVDEDFFTDFILKDKKKNSLKARQFRESLSSHPQAFSQRSQNKENNFHQSQEGTIWERKAVNCHTPVTKRLKKSDAYKSSLKTNKNNV